VLLEQVQNGPLLNFTYLVGEREGAAGVVIDPSYGTDAVLEAIDARRLKVAYILNTHSHPDHTAGNDAVRDRTGAKVVAHRSTPDPPDVPVDDGGSIRAGTLEIRVVHVPGHTPDSVLFIFPGHVATGDTLFVGEVGRTDLPGGDPRAFHDSLLRTVVGLDDALVVLPGHDYGVTPTSTIGREKQENDALRPRTLDEFLEFLGE
jgi:hydroxyacylglutathione hydrolase